MGSYDIEQCMHSTCMCMMSFNNIVHVEKGIVLKLTEHQEVVRSLILMVLYVSGLIT